MGRQMESEKGKEKTQNRKDLLSSLGSSMTIRKHILHTAFHQ